MDSPIRRSGIPVPKTKHNNTPMKKSLYKSNDDLLAENIEPQSLNTDLDVFTLLEENIALKEKIEELTVTNNLISQKNVQYERDNSRLGMQLNDLKVQQMQLKDQLQHLMEKFQKEMEDSQTIHNIQEQQKKTIKELMLKVRQQDEKHDALLKTGKQAKHRIEELAPEIRLKLEDDDIKSDIITADAVEKLINEISNIKTQMNNTELQLYEANEKIAELVDSHQHLKDENESLKMENSNLTKVAKLMTNSMKESMDTSKRMEEALIKMKLRNDELIRGNRDAIDSPTSTEFLSNNDQVMHLKDELKRRDAAHTERIVEMTKLMETTIETNNNNEIEMLRIKLEMVEKELQLAISRAEKAENELEQLKNTKNSNIERNTNQSMICSHCGKSLNESNSSTISTNATSTPNSSAVEPIKMPPVPPPLPNFNLVPNNNFNRSGSSLSDSIAAFMLNNSTPSQSSQPKPKPATGMDALIAELRDGRVTLKRNRRVNATSAALKEMFETLELSKKQNQNSRIVIESHKPLD